MEKHSFFDNFSELKENLKVYLETKVSYYGITAFGKTVKALTILTSNGFVILLLWMSLMFFSGAVAFYLGNLFESIELGLLIVGGAYLFLGIIIFLLRNQIFAPIIIRLLYNVLFKDEEEEEEEFQNKKK